MIASAAVRRALLALALVLVPGCKQEAPGGAPPPPAPRPPAASATASASVTRPADAPPADELRYLERTTGGASADETLPLLVAIHGLGDRPETFVHLFDQLHARARLVLPYGPDPYQGGFAWFPIGGGPRLNFDNIAAGTERAALRLAKLIGALEKRRPTVGRPIVTGFSQGGMLSFTLAVLHPDVVGEAYPVSGLLAPLHFPSSWAAGKIEPKVVAFHGEIDHLVPIAVTRQGVDRLKGIGFDASLHEYPGVDHAISADMRRDLFQALDEAVQRASKP